MKKILNLFHRVQLAFSRRWFVSLEKDLACIGIKEVSTVFDVGAHLGQTTLHFRKVFPHAQVHSFEPIPQNFTKLQRNVAGKDRIKVNQKALGSSPGSAFMEIGDSDQTHAIRSRSQNEPAEATQSPKVELGTIDTYLAKEGIASIDLLKIDVEGYELEVLKGATKALQSGSIQSIFAECDFDPDDHQHTYFNDLWGFLRRENYAFIGLYDVIHYTNTSGIGYCNALFINKRPLSQPRRT